MILLHMHQMLRQQMAAWIIAIFLCVAVRGQVLCPGMQFDTGGVAAPAGSNETVAAEFLDRYPDVFIHAQAIPALYEAAPGAAWLRMYENRARTLATPVHEFDLNVCRLVQGTATNDVKLLNDGLNNLKALCERTDHAGMWLAYAVYLAHVDVAQFGRSPHSMSPMKVAVTQAVMRAVAVHKEYPQRGFPASLRAALAYLGGFPAYAAWSAAVHVPAPVSAATVHYWNGLLCLRGTQPAAGASALAAGLLSGMYVVECNRWRTTVQLPSYDEFSFAVEGSSVAVRRNGACYLYRARDGAQAARVPRVAQWELTAGNSMAAVRNALTPPNSYDIDLIDLRSGSLAAALYRECAMNVRVQKVAVARDQRHALVQYRLDNGACDVDVWDVERGVLRTTLANRGGLPAGFTPDSLHVVRSLSPSEYVLDALASIRGGTPVQALPTLRINTRRMLERYDFLRDGSVMLCWSQRRTPCDAWALCDIQQSGTLLAARAPQGGFDGIAALDNGVWFVTWRGTALTVWSLAHGARPRLMHTLTLPGAVRAVALSPHAPLLAAADAHGCLYVWHLEPTGLRAWPPWATGDPDITWLQFDLASAALYAHSRSNQMIYAAPLQAGGLLDSCTVTGWNPMTHPLMPRQAGPVLATPERHAPVRTTAPSAPPLHNTDFFTIHECLTIDYADLDGDGMEEALVSARGAVDALAPGALYFADGAPLVPSGTNMPACASNEFWYGVLRHNIHTKQWTPLLMGVSANKPDSGALPLVTCRFAAFSNAPALFVEHAVQHVDGMCRRTLYAAHNGTLTTLFEHSYHAAEAEIEFDAARARIVVTEPLYPAVSRATAHVPLFMRTARVAIVGMQVQPLDVDVRLLPAAASDDAVETELLEVQAQAAHGQAPWRYDALAYVSHLAPGVQWRMQHTDGTTAVMRAVADVPGLPDEIVLYRPFFNREGTSIWHHAVPRIALPAPERAP